MKRSIRTLAATAVLVLATGRAYADESYDGASGRYGRGKDVARVPGALIGGAIGHNVSVGRQRERDARAQTYERCDVRHRERTVERIRVRVDASPAEG